MRTRIKKAAEPEPTAAPPEKSKRERKRDERAPGFVVMVGTEFSIERVDERNWIARQLTRPDPRHHFAKENAAPRWSNLGYFARPSSALRHVVRVMGTEVSESIGLAEYVARVEKCHDAIEPMRAMVEQIEVLRSLLDAHGDALDAARVRAKLEELEAKAVVP